MKGVTQGLLCSSFLGLLWFLVRDCNIVPKKELHRRVWVVGVGVCRLFWGGSGFRVAPKCSVATGGG